MYVAQAAQSGDLDPTQPVPGQVVEPAAVSAVRFTGLPDGATADLVLTLAPNNNADVSQQAPQPLTLYACLPASQWDPIQAGDWASHPTWDCDTDFVKGESSQAGQAIEFAFPASFITNGTLDVILVPQGTTPYQLAFDPPDSLALTVTGGTDPSADPGPTVDATPDPGFGSGDVALGGAGLGDLGTTAGDLGASTLPSTAITTPRRATGPTLPVATAVPVLPLDKRGERIMAVALLLALAAALWWVGGQPMRSPRLLGSVAGGTTTEPEGARSLGGVGRFARPRVGRPTRL
jgi:hypothetical protein